MDLNRNFLRIFDLAVKPVIPALEPPGPSINRNASPDTPILVIIVCPIALGIAIHHYV